MSNSSQSSLLPEAIPDAGSLARAAALAGTPGHFDELRRRLTESGGGVPSALAPLWQRFFAETGSDGWVDLGARLASVQRRVREDGASFNVHADGDDGARPWPLELLPLLIGADEWAHIEKGAVQRARMLEAAVSDLYGPRDLLQRGLLPASLVLGHPQYMRPMHGARPAGGRWLYTVGIDLARGPDGLWWVVGHRAQAPSGLGYLLENRLIISQQFAPAFAALKVQRIAAVFRTLMEGLNRASPAGERSRVALLTPGPRNETYFEQVFLARYLGVALVEGSDLTVRDQRLYLKTLHGLERVHVLLRRVDDEWLDPLELRPDSALGVPGLMQAVRAGELVLANAPGAGVLESPGLTAFWPGVAEHLLGEELILPASTSWWCGEAAVWREMRPQLDEFVVAPTFPAGPVTQDFVPVAAGLLSPSDRVALASRIDADPAAHTLLASLRPSETPVWRNGRLEPRPAVVRVYAMADGQGGWTVLPGGFTRVAHVGSPAQHNTRSTGADAFLSMQRGSASVDTWVLTDGAVDTTTLLPQALAPSELTVRHRVVTSRAAENLFWLGRYTERAEATLRLARLTLESLASGTEPVLSVLHELTVGQGLVDAEVPSPVQGRHARRLFERALVRSLADATEGGSLAFNLACLRQCASSLRERLSPEHWRLIQSADEGFAVKMRGLRGAEDAGPVLGDVLAVLGSTGTMLSAITGKQTDRMTRDDGWRLLSVGRMIERLDGLSQVLALGFEAGLPAQDEGFALLLGLFDSTITYRAHFQSRREVLPLVHLLVLDLDNPRSLGWVARTMRERLRKLARHDRAWADSVCAELPAPDRWSFETLGLVNQEVDHTRFIAAVRECSGAARGLSDAIGRHLFSHVGATQRFVWQ